MYTIGGKLYHHGILGMKWGERNGPPYPLGSSDHSSSEKKAGWRKSLSSDSDYRERERKNISYRYNNMINAKDSKIAKKQKKFEKQYDKIRQKAKTDEEKDKKIRKLEEKYNVEILNLNKGKDMTKALLDAELGKIDVMDVKQDKINKAKHVVTDVAASIAVSAAASYSLSPFGIGAVYVISRPYNRLSTAEQKDIVNKIAKEYDDRSKS